MQVISLCSWWIVLFLIPHLSALLCLSPSLPYLLPLLPTVLSLLSLCILNPFPVSPSLPSVSHFPSIRCPNDYTGDRCENSVMAGFYSMSICSCLSPFPLRCCMLHWRGWMVEMLNVCVFNVTILFHWSRRVCVWMCEGVFAWLLLFLPPLDPLLCSSGDQRRPIKKCETSFLHAVKISHLL